VSLLRITTALYCYYCCCATAALCYHFVHHQKNSLLYSQSNAFIALQKRINCYAGNVPFHSLPFRKLALRSCQLQVEANSGTGSPMFNSLQISSNTAVVAFLPGVILLTVL
jgi:hypothetical protein